MISFYIMIILWLIAPIVLIPSVIVLYVKYNNLKKKFEELRLGQIPKEELKTTQKPVVKPLMAEPTMVNTPTVNLVKVNPAAVSAVPKAHKKTGGAVNATLVTGVLFVLAAGIIFATTTWKIMPDFMKVLLISSLAILFFAVSFFAEIKLKLRMTGIAFYHLGCLFVPVAILAIGYFELMGEWFSLYGSGRYWLQFVMAVFFGVLTILGYKRYKMISFYYVSWAASFCALWLLSRGVGNNWARCWLWQSVYGTGIITWAVMKKKKNWLRYIHPLFASGCILQAMLIYCGEFSFGVMLYSFSMLAFFTVYRFSGRFLPISFDTVVSRWFFPCMVIFGALIKSGQEQFGVSAFLYLSVIVCLTSVFLGDVTRVEKLSGTWLIMGTVGFLFYPLFKMFIVMTGLESEVGYLVVFTAVILFLLAGKLLLKGRYDSYLFKHPANCLTAFFTFLGLVCFGADGAGVWLLWEILILWIVLRRSYVYAVFAAILMLILPSLTLWTLHLNIHSMFYWIIMAVAGLSYHCISRFRKMSLHHFKMFQVCGTIGLHIGFLLSCVLYFWLSPGSLMEGSFLLFFIVAADICNIRKYGNMGHSGIHIMLIPIISLLVYHNFYKDNNFFAFVSLLSAMIMMLAGRKLFRRIIAVKEENGRKVCRFDYLGMCSASAFILVCIQMTEPWLAAAMIFLSLWSLNWYKRQNEFVNIISIAGAMLSLYAALIILTFGVIPVEMGWLLISVTGLLFCFLSYREVLEYRVRTVLQVTGFLGFYAGFLISASVYLSNSNVLVYTGIYLLAVISAADMLGIYKRDSIKYSLVNVAAIPLICRYIIYCYPDGEVYSRIASLTAGILMMAGGRILFSRMFTVIKEENNTRYEADFLGLISLCGIFGAFYNSHTWIFIGLLYAAIWSFNWYHRQSEVLDSISLISVQVFLFCAWIKQPFFQIPGLYLTEYYFLALLFTCIACAVIWKKRKVYVEIYWFVIGVCFAVVQGLDCISGEALWDVMFLGIVMLLILFMAYKKRELRWLTLSLITLAVLVLYASRSFWMNIAWWVYLLLAGLLLIGIAASHEYRKREGGSREHRWSEFKDVWKW